MEPFNLFITRHSIAENGNLGMPDSERCLTSAGEKRAEVLGDNLKRFGINHIYSSTFKRTAQTATIIQGCIGGFQKITTLKELTPGKDLFDSLSAFYDVFKSTSPVLLLGHQPQVSDLVFALTKKVVESVPPATTFLISVPSWSIGAGELVEIISGDKL